MGAAVALPVGADPLLELAFEQAPMAVVIIGLDGRFARVNRAFCTLLGYERDELLGRRFIELTFPDAVEHDKDVFERLVSGRSTYVRIAKRQIHRLGHLVETTVNVGRVADAGGATLFLVAQFENMTEARREAEALEARAAMLEQLRQTGEERAVLLREIHHRVKNNLQVISSLLNLQARQTGDLPTRAAIEDAQSRVRSIAVIHEMLYQTPDLARVDMQEYVGHLARLLSHSFGAREIALEVRCEKVVLPVDQAVPCGLILNELLTNAFKYAFRPLGVGGARIVIEMVRVEHEMRLSVADNGVGLPPSVDPQTTPTLGLSLMRMLAQQLRGKLEARADGGTVVRVSFPLEPVK